MTYQELKDAPNFIEEINLPIKNAESMLIEKTKNKNSEIFKKLLIQTEETLPVYRDIRDDGNCNYNFTI